MALLIRKLTGFALATLVLGIAVAGAVGLPNGKRCPERFALIHSESGSWNCLPTGTAREPGFPALTETRTSWRLVILTAGVLLTVWILIRLEQRRPIASSRLQ
jgi:hypothetical protein